MPRVNERGLSESVQLAVIWPALMLVTLGLIQTGIWLHGRNVAERAATAAVDAARGSEGTSAAAEELGVDLARAGGLDEVSVTVVRSATAVSATVTGTAPLIFDLGMADLHETAAAPLERVTAP